MSVKGTRTRAIMGSFVFFLVAPAVVAGVVPFALMGWTMQPPLLGLPGGRVVGGAGLVTQPPDDGGDGRPVQATDATPRHPHHVRPRWLDETHTELDGAVANAYGWPSDIAACEALRELMELGISRSAT